MTIPNTYLNLTPELRASSTINGLNVGRESRIFRSSRSYSTAIKSMFVGCSLWAQYREKLSLGH
jgi:hypothetical protein